MADMSYTAQAVIGNRALLSRLERDIRDGALSHAYILDGPVGSGRHTIARHICASIACHNRPGRTVVEQDPDQIGFFDAFLPPEPVVVDENAPLPCGTCPACEKVYGNKCPDIHIIGRDGKASIGVESVRFLRRDVLTAPNDLDTKIYIIEDAESMTLQAQNAFLLTLEEPPPYVLFLLLCNGTENLLETIKSRAPILRTQPVSDAEVRAYLQAVRRSLPEEDLRAVLLRANGCIGQALALSDPKAVKPLLKQRALADDFIRGCAQRHTDLMLAAITQFGNKRDVVMDVLGYVLLALRDLITLKSSDTVPLKYYTDPEVAQELAYRMSARFLLDIYDAVNGACEDLDRNGNIRLTLTRMCLNVGI